MNYSPLNDPEFNEYREVVRKTAAKKRRTKALILLTVCALLALLSFSLLALAAADAAPAVIDFFESLGKNETSGPAVQPSSPHEDSQKPALPSEKEEPSSPAKQESPSKDVPAPSPSNDTPVRVTTVYVDAGHGFTNSYGALDVGAGEGSEYYRLSLEKQGAGLYEADLNLSIALKVKALLEAEGYKVIMSREGYVNQHLSINERAQNAKKSEADLVVSIHGNSSSPAAYGARVFYSDRRNDSLDLAKAVAEAIDKNGASRKKTTTNLDNTLAMVNSVGKPAVLVETCFLTNTEDSELALTDAWLDAMAQSIADGIIKTFPCQTYFE